MTHVPYDATECACGRSFELDKPNLTRTAEAIRSESEERLYEAYLEARMQQTLDTLRAVREECGTGGKWTREQAEKIRHALKAVDLARRDLTAQRQKAVDASEVAQVAKTRRAQRRTGKPESVPMMPAVQGFSPAMPENQRAAQALMAEQLSRPTQTMQQCPHCSATVTTDATHCGCGYEFPIMTLVPELVLPAEEYLVVDSSNPAPRATS
ncbi:MAG: hypothetical protein HY082_03025 [Gammaproteobacteria bacterium]|nr:hypothetical protein [Gammaproteobacteria bacterium]